MEYLKINTLNLNTKVKGVLLHSGYSLVSDLIEHKQDKYSRLVTDPELTEEQKDQLTHEVT
jgi:hypothetical protein